MHGYANPLKRLDTSESVNLHKCLILLDSCRIHATRWAQRFFKRALGREHTRNPREVVTDRLKSYPGALREMKQKRELWRFAQHRRGRWLNNRVEQDHRRIKRLTRPMLGFQGFWTAKRTLAGIEAMAMLAKGQVRAVLKG
ncbi:MAG: DDE-type integrase/transposase/recombinase [Rhodopila sp.]